jgi:outer membrane lipoprotein carrier protein
MKNTSTSNRTFTLFMFVNAALSVFGLFAIGVICARAVAAEVSVPLQSSTVVDRVQDHYQHTQSFGAKFSEELTGVGRPKLIRSGQVFFKRPGKMRWEFDTPQKEIVVSDGHKLYNYQPDLNQVIELPIERAFKSAAPLAFLLGIGNMRRDFTASLPLSTPTDGLVHVTLVPKGGGERLEMGLDPSTYDLTTVKVTDALGNTTSITFSAVRTNIQLSDALFNFQVPPGADVVEAPGAPAPEHL